MSRSVFIRTSLLTVLASGHAVLAEGGFFYAIEPDNGADRVYRIDVDEDFQPTVTPIGDEGSLGYPQVRGIVWDSDGERLLGFDTQFDVWLEIDTTTGAATVLGTFSRAPFDLTYNPNDGMVYGLEGNSLWRIDPNTGEATLAVSSIATIGLAHVLDTTGGLDGLFTARASGLTLVAEPDFELIDFGGNVQGRRAMMWDPSTDTLYNYSGGATHDWYVVNQVTGSEVLVAHWDLDITVLAITFVQTEPQPLTCDRMDSDDDGDIDLIDFAAFQACFNGPLE